MNRIIWLASYPKSGNTWMRVLLTNLWLDLDGPAHINRLIPTRLAAERDLFDRVVGYDSGDLTEDEVDLLRPDVYRHYAKQAEDHLYIKVHDAYTLLPDGQPLFPTDATAGVIYLIRNPLDVCVSYAHHCGRKPKIVVEWMSDPNFILAPVEHVVSADQLQQRMLTWSEHVLSWVDRSHLRVHVVRYEDLKTQPVETLTAAAAFVGMTQDPAKINRAVEHSKLEELQRQEREHGFGEGLAADRQFFRKGKSGSWREELTDEQVARMINDHRAVMRRFGYLTESDEIVY